MQFNYIDLIILLVVVFFIFEAVRHGFFVILFDFISFAGSLLISLKTYSYFSHFIQERFVINRSFSNALGFIIIAIFFETLLSVILALLIRFIPKKLKQNRPLKILSIVPGIGEALVLISFILLLVIGLPVSPKIKADISSSKLSSYLIEKTQNAEAILRDVFGGIVDETISYTIVDPESNKTVVLEAIAGDLKADYNAENKMFEMVNTERQKINIEGLVWFEPAVIVAEEYAEYMWKNNYFGHISPDGEDVGDRLEKTRIDYFIVGENLALAPTVQTAMTGLMNSEGHRRNILDPNFNKVAIGVVDNGIYGKMFVQIFIK